MEQTVCLIIGVDVGLVSRRVRVNIPSTRRALALMGGWSPIGRFLPVRRGCLSSWQALSLLR